MSENKVYLADKIIECENTVVTKLRELLNKSGELIDKSDELDREIGHHINGKLLSGSLKRGRIVLPFKTKDTWRDTEYESLSEKGLGSMYSMSSQTAYFGSATTIVNSKIIKGFNEDTYKGIKDYKAVMVKEIFELLNSYRGKLKDKEELSAFLTIKLPENFRQTSHFKSEFHKRASGSEIDEVIIKIHDSSIYIGKATAERKKSLGKVDRYDCECEFSANDENHWEEIAIIEQLMSEIEPLANKYIEMLNDSINMYNTFKKEIDDKFSFYTVAGEI
jgi:hypothetical protein